MSTLYRNYRPQRFGEVFGQPQVTDVVKRAIETGKVTHAYLFTGARGTGKTTTARILAKQLFCLDSSENEPCTKCEACQASQEGRNVDIVEIDAASHRGIDDIRALREGVQLRPVSGKYKAYIIDEVHMLTKEAFAALLKTLEEPPARVVFILATTEMHKVPETIVSRCQVFRFRRASNVQMQERLKWILDKEGRMLDDGALDLIIQRSEGCYRDAESLLGQVLASKEGEVVKEDVEALLGLPPLNLLENFIVGMVRGESALAIEAIETLFGEGYDPEQILREAVLLARTEALRLVKGQGGKSVIANETEAGDKLPEVIRALVMALQDLAFVPQPLLAIQLAVLTICESKGSVEKVTVAVDKPVRDGEVSLEAMKNNWPEVVQKMREVNPVASTFLRAVEPLEIAGDKLTLRAKYPLHKNFFSKPEHAELVQKSLQEVIGSKLQVTCVLSENGESGNGDELYNTVKEVFGDKIKM